MVTTNTAYAAIAKNMERSLGTIAGRQDVRRESEYYSTNIRKVKSIDDFLKDDRLFNFAMTAHGLKDMIYAKAFMRKVLTEGVDGSKSFSLMLADGRFRDFAEVFNFARYGATATAFDRAQQGTVDKFVRMRLEEEAGKTDEGVRLALYFERRAGEVESVYGLLGDPALYKVVQTALGLPAALSGRDVDKQAALIASRIDVDSLRSEDGRNKVIGRFTALWQAQAGIAAGTVPQFGPVTPLALGVGNATLLSLQTLKRGGGR